MALKDDGGGPERTMHVFCCEVCGAEFTHWRSAFGRKAAYCDSCKVEVRRLNRHRFFTKRRSQEDRRRALGGALESDGVRIEWRGRKVAGGTPRGNFF
jgi:hypothetical protein